MIHLSDGVGSERLFRASSLTLALIRRLGTGTSFLAACDIPTSRSRK